MIECSVRGCDAFASELSCGHATLARWIILKPCQCAHGPREECKCNRTLPTLLWGIIPIQYWPNLDWWAFGGVDKLCLCPDHKVLVAKEIIRQRQQDPSMDSGERVNPANRH